MVSREEWRDSLPESIRTILRDDGTLPAYTSIGSYTLVYYTARGECLCSKCASDPSAENVPAMVDVYWEGPAIQCEDCGEDIESSYGDPAENK